ncbi:MAG: NAD-dependent epimerase/dehydratase family protein [Bradymonadales bacterium]|nr:MAG: NAD-dependent epimerase/dehydratase family protein [Bradymonadales bacterium]
MPSRPGPRLLVTGATGFLGRHLVSRLQGLGFETRCLVRESSSSSPIDALGAEIYRGDLSDLEFLRQSLENRDILIHCAALVSDWATVKEIEEANVLLTKRLLQAAKACGIKKFVHISTTDVYGHPGSPSVNESTPLPTSFSNWYAETKRDAEQLVQASPLDYCILRPATIFGPYSTAMLGEIAKALCFGKMLMLNQGRSIAGLTFVDHVVDAILLIMENPKAKNQVFNISDESPVCWRQFLTDLSHGLGCPLNVIQLPLPLAKIAGFGLEVSYRQLRSVFGIKSRPLLSRQAVQILSIDQSFSSQKIKSELGWAPAKTYEMGLKETIDWALPFVQGCRSQ